MASIFRVEEQAKQETGIMQRLGTKVWKEADIFQFTH
jgi:hypothetical protein